MRGRVKPTRDPDRIDYEESECEETEDAVHMLPDDLRLAVIQHYVIRGSPDDQAEALKCSVKTVYNRLDRAESMMLDLMNEAALKRAGLGSVSV